MSGQALRTVAQLFTAPYAVEWLPAFAAAAIGDPVAGEALGPFLGPPTERVAGTSRSRVPGHEHFARTWAVIKPGFVGTGQNERNVEHTRADHRRTRIPGHLVALPIQWIEVLTATVVHGHGRNEQLVAAIRAAALRFGASIEADPTVVGLPLRQAKANLARYFANVDIVTEQALAFWGAMDHGLVRRDLGGTPGRVNVPAVQTTLTRHMPARLVSQYMRHAPR